MKRLYKSALSQIRVEDELIQKAERLIAENKNSKRPHKKLYRFAAAAACLALIAAAFPICIRFLPLGAHSQSKNSSVDSAPAEISRETGPVKYSSLRFAAPDKILDTSALKNAFVAMDIASFDEEREVKSADIICKGTVTDCYIKEYRYDTYSDKFEKNGRMHHTAQTYVAALRIDEAYYTGKGGINAGDVIKIEYTTGFICGETYELQQNRQYILPLYYRGNGTILRSSDDYASGDVKLDGQYSLTYPYAPQIQTTLDGQYVFPNCWRSLANEKAVSVEMDDGKDNAGDYYSDKMKLRGDSGFIADLKEMIKKYKGLS